MAISAAQADEEKQALEDSHDYVCKHLDSLSQVCGKLRSDRVITISDEERINVRFVYICGFIFSSFFNKKHAIQALFRLKMIAKNCCSCSGIFEFHCS
jgi:hypothetical protein